MIALNYLPEALYLLSFIILNFPQTSENRFLTAIGGKKTIAVDYITVFYLSILSCLNMKRRIPEYSKYLDNPLFFTPVSIFLPDKISDLRYNCFPGLYRVTGGRSVASCTFT